MERIIQAEELVKNLDQYIIIDLRSPLEYQKGKIKSAINIPLFNDQIRAMIGTLYKQDKAKAYQEGYAIGTDVLPLIEAAIAKYNQKICFYCARGGSRSNAVFKSLLVKGYDVYKLHGGYKQYRNYILTTMDEYLQTLDFLVLSGNTGSGKTILLNKLYNLGYPVIDLEKLANHRGSLFGSLGQGDQPNQRDFEDALFYELKQYIDTDVKQVLIESESRKVGDIYLPTLLVNKIKTNHHLLVSLPVAKRSQIILEMYDANHLDPVELKTIVGNYCFVKRQGYEWVKRMHTLIDQHQYLLLVENLLNDYYDLLYANSQDKYQYQKILEANELDDILYRIIEYLNQKQ